MKSNTLRLVTLLLSVLITVSLLGACKITPPVSNITDRIYTYNRYMPPGEVSDGIYFCFRHSFIFVEKI